MLSKSYIHLRSGLNVSNLQFIENNLWAPQDDLVTLLSLADKKLTQLHLELDIEDGVYAIPRQSIMVQVKPWYFNKMVLQNTLRSDVSAILKSIHVRGNCPRIRVA